MKQGFYLAFFNSIENKWKGPWLRFFAFITGCEFSSQKSPYSLPPLAAQTVQHSTTQYCLFLSKRDFSFEGCAKKSPRRQVCVPTRRSGYSAQGHGKNLTWKQNIRTSGRSKLTKSNPCTRGFFPQGGTRGAEVCPALLMVKEADEGDWATCVPQGSCTMKPLGMKQPSVTPFPSLTLGCSALTSSSKSSLQDARPRRGKWSCISGYENQSTTNTIYMYFKINK